MAFDERSLKDTEGRAGAAVDQDVQRFFVSTWAKINYAQPLDKQVYWQCKSLLAEHSDMKIECSDQHLTSRQDTFLCRSSTSA